MIHKFKLSAKGLSSKIITVQDFEKNTDWTDFEDALAEAVKKYCYNVDTSDMLNGLDVTLLPENFEDERSDNERFLITSQPL